MTATIETRPTAPTIQRRAPRRRRVLIAAAVLAAVAAAAVGLRPGDQPGMHSLVPLDEAVQGTYRLEDGRHLTLWGSERSPSYELDGRITALMADGADRYTAMAGDDSLSVERDGTAAVRGVTLQQAGQPPVFANRDLLHRRQEVRFASTGAELAGTLLLPPGPGPHPAVVFVHGADRGSRHGIYRLLGSHLARRGVATLIYDKRGVGESTGSHEAATFDDLTADALAGVDVLTGHPAVDPARIGVLGFSQGGWVVAQAAERSSDIAFVIGFSPSGVSPADQQAWLHGSMLAARGFDAPAMVIADRVSRMLYSSVDLVEAGIMPSIPQVPGFWFHSLDLRIDSVSLWENVDQPVLLAWGALDCQVPAHDSMDLLGAALHRGGNTDVTFAVLPEADHSFMLAEPCGHETGLAHHGSMHYADGYFELGPEWIHNVGNPDEPRPQPPVAPRPDATVLDWHLEPPAATPWHGGLPAQLTALLLLLTAFGLLAANWLAAGVRRVKSGAAVGPVHHLAGVVGLVGLLATVTGFAAFTEIAMLGDTHAAFLVGGPTVDGASTLMTAARALVPLTGALAAASVVAALRTRRRGLSGLTLASTVGGAVTLVVWAAYWQLLPFI